MFKATITLIIPLLLLINFSAISKNNPHFKVEEASLNSSIKGAYLQETGVSIISFESVNSTSCSPPYGSAEILQISKDGVIEDISNFSITWYDHNNNVMSSGPSIANLSPGHYTVSAIHLASEVASSPLTINIHDESVYPLVSLIAYGNTSCDPLNPNGYLEAFIHEQYEQYDPSKYNFTWFEGTMHNPGNMVISNHDMAFELSAGIYTVEVMDNVTGCMTHASMEVFDDLKIPELNFSVKPNTSCLTNGEIEITGITEASISQNMNDYEYSLFNSNYELIKKSVSPLFTELTGGTYYLSVKNNYTLCESNKTEVIINNEYNMSGPSSDFTVVGPNADFSICGSGSMTLEAQGGEHFRWYNSALEGDILYEGAVYTVENLQESRSIFVAAYDPICTQESDRKEVLLKVVNLPLISSLTSNNEQASLVAQVNGDIKWFLNGEIIEGKTESSIVAYKDGNYTIEVSNSECLETNSIHFIGLAFSESESLISGPQILNASYEWSKNGLLLEQEKSHTLAVSENGSYAVKIVYEIESGGLKVQQNLAYAIEVNSLDVVMSTQSKVQSQNIKIYPIPFKATINLEFLQDIGEKFTLRLRNMNGKLIFSKDQLMLENKRLTLDIPDLEKGVYMLEVIHSKGSYISKVVN